MYKLEIYLSNKHTKKYFMTLELKTSSMVKYTLGRRDNFPISTINSFSSGGNSRHTQNSG